ncbi:MAG: C40 family peptidase [Oscillospiraceae bacterium]|nr:C40 family peptidase [Oscillospiraceae bacterium]
MPDYSKYASGKSYLIQILPAFIVLALITGLLASCIGLPSNTDTDTDIVDGGDDGSSLRQAFIRSQSVPYDENTVVVVNTAADIYESADRTSRRITQVLFNHPIQVLAQSDRWAKVEVDGTNSGWIRTRDIDSDWTCVDPRRYKGRIVVTNREKQIMSQPRGGVVIRDIGMGAELFFYTRSDSIFEVALPGNLTGWISETGTFQLEVDEPIKKTSAEVFAQSCEKFIGTSYLQGGASSLGIDSAGIIYVAMKINGVLLPRDYESQFKFGKAVPVDDLENVSESEMSVGDVLFFSAAGRPQNGEDAQISEAGVYMGEGSFLHASQHTGKVQLSNISDEYYVQKLIGIMRYFS